MSTFEWVLISLVLIGVVLPVWLFLLAAFVAAKRPRPTEPSARYFAYLRIIDAIHSQMKSKDFVVENGAAFAATIRELKGYPEYRDLSLLYLEELTITGSKKFDHVLRNELEAVESQLLGTKSG